MNGSVQVGTLLSKRGAHLLRVGWAHGDLSLVVELQKEHAVTAVDASSDPSQSDKGGSVNTQDRWLQLRG